MANVTATNTTQWSFLTIWPNSLTVEPNISDLNWVSSNTTIANMDNIVLGQGTASPPNGYANITNAFGSTDVIVDVFGYYS
jgi:hypothetical protein